MSESEAVALASSPTKFRSSAASITSSASAINNLNAANDGGAAALELGGRGLGGHDASAASRDAVGGYDYSFVEEVGEDLICQICSKVY